MKSTNTEQTTKKETFLRKLSRISKRPIFAVIILSLAFICFITNAVLPEYSYNQANGTVEFINPDSFCTSASNWSAFVDDNKNIYCVDEMGKLVYALDVNELPYDNAEIIDITFDSCNLLYCHIAIYNENSYITDLEVILEIDTTGQFKREIVHYDYSKSLNPPSHQTQIYGLHFQGDTLNYIYVNDNKSTIVSLNPDTPQNSNMVSFTEDGFAEIIKCHSTTDGKFLLLKNNGEIGLLSQNGKYNPLYKSSYNAKTRDGIFINDAIYINDTLYVLAGHDKLSLYKLENNDLNLLVPVTENIGISETTNIYYSGLGILNSKPVIHINEALYILDNENALEKYTADFSLPSNIILIDVLKSILPILGIILLFIGIYLAIGNLMKWHLSILSKQLLSTIPLVLLLIIVVVVTMLISMVNLNSEDIIRETIAINEIAATQFDGEELKNISGYEDVETGQIADINKRLRDFINGNQNFWSHNYNLALYVRTTDEKYICIATSDNSNQYMSATIDTETPIEQNFYEDSHTYPASVSLGDSLDKLHLLLLTPIYSEDGSYDAIIMLNASQDQLIKAILSTGKTLLIQVILLITLLITVIAIVTAQNAKSLKRAKNVIAQIAGGDFSVRVDKYTKDEVGEICMGVNDMADQLEAYFKEKNRNEQFYYKFVPEKFRELLHKDKFTDLSLGDAQSEDLSILFCDIRAFSLNSEMMTARESFDFVNKIYGKAGPIIRKHNGFIDKYIGDAIMALFEHADDAVAAGIELYQAIALNPNSEQDFGIPEVKIGIGIHSGMARIGIVGEEERMSGTVISNTVNLSSRIESLTKKYGAGMIISKDTFDRMKNPDILSTRYLGMVQVAGVKEVSALYEVLDCLDDEQLKQRSKTTKEFREAIRLFHTGQLQQSLEKFKSISKENPEDNAPLLYYSYIEEKLMCGDTEHNVFRFENK